MQKTVQNIVLFFSGLAVVPLVTSLLLLGGVFARVAVFFAVVYAMAFLLWSKGAENISAPRAVLKKMFLFLWLYTGLIGTVFLFFLIV